MPLGLCPQVVFQRFEIIWLGFKTSYQFIKMPWVALCCTGRHITVTAAAIVMLGVTVTSFDVIKMLCYC